MDDASHAKKDPMERVLSEAFERANLDGKRYMLDVRERTSQLTAREFIWVQQLAACIADLASDSVDWRSLELFWVRTHALLVDLLPRWEKAQAQIDAAGASHAPLAVMRFIQLKALRAIRDVVVEHEVDIIAVDYHRQRACHMQQSKFRLQYDPKRNALQPDVRSNPLNGKPYNVEQMDEALAAVDELSVARDLSQRMRPSTDRLVVAFDIMSDDEKFKAFMIKAFGEARRWSTPAIEK